MAIELDIQKNFKGFSLGVRLKGQAGTMGILGASGSAQDSHGSSLPLQPYTQGKTFKIFLNIKFNRHYIHLLVCIPLPETILIAATTRNEINMITTTQKPAIS